MARWRFLDLDQQLRLLHNSFKNLLFLYNKKSDVLLSNTSRTAPAHYDDNVSECIRNIKEIKTRYNVLHNVVRGRLNNKNYSDEQDLEFFNSQFTFLNNKLNLVKRDFDQSLEPYNLVYDDELNIFKNTLENTDSEISLESIEVDSPSSSQLRKIEAGQGSESSTTIESLDLGDCASSSDKVGSEEKTGDSQIESEPLIESIQVTNSDTKSDLEQVASEREIESQTFNSFEMQLNILEPKSVSSFSEKINIVGNPKIVVAWDSGNPFNKPSFVGFRIDFQIGSNSGLKDKFLIRRNSTVLRIQNNGENYFLSAGRFVHIKKGKIESNFKVPLTKNFSILKQNSTICVRSEFNPYISNISETRNFLQPNYNLEEKVMIGKDHVFSKLKQNSKEEILQKNNTIISNKENGFNDGWPSQKEIFGMPNQSNSLDTNSHGLSKQVKNKRFNDQRVIDSRQDIRQCLVGEPVNFHLHPPEKNLNIYIYPLMFSSLVFAGFCFLKNFFKNENENKD